jgi:hypothetical protein
VPAHFQVSGGVELLPIGGYPVTYLPVTYLPVTYLPVTYLFALGKYKNVHHLFFTLFGVKQPCKKGFAKKKEFGCKTGGSSNPLAVVFLFTSFFFLKGKTCTVY